MDAAEERTERTKPTPVRRRAARAPWLQVATHGSGASLILLGFGGCMLANNHHDFNRENAIGQTANELANINANIWPAAFFVSGVIICCSAAVISRITKDSSERGV
jgi:hypothetical protein